jgi:hypothetical protein
MCRTPPFKKAKNADEDRSSRSRPKKERDGPYMNVNTAWVLRH